MQLIRERFIKILKDNSDRLLNEYTNRIAARALKILTEDANIKEEYVVGFCGGWSWFVKNNPKCNRQYSSGLVIAQNPFTMSVVNPKLNSSDKLMLEAAKVLTNNSFNFINVYPFRHYKLKDGILDLDTDIPSVQYRWEGAMELVQDILNYLDPKLIVLIGQYSKKNYYSIRPVKYKNLKEISIRHPARNHKRFREELMKADS